MKAHLDIKTHEAVTKLSRQLVMNSFSLHDHIKQICSASRKSLIELHKHVVIHIGNVHAQNRLNNYISDLTLACPHDNIKLAFSR